MTDVFFSKTTQTNASFVPPNILDIYPVDSKGYKTDSIVLPPLCQLASYYNLLARTAVSNQPITNNPIVDFIVQDPDYITNTYAVITLTNTSGSAVNLKSYLIFQRLEFLDSANNILSTVYQNNFIDKFLMLDQFKINRLAYAEGFNPANFGATQIPANSSVTISIVIPGLAQQNALKTSLINSGLGLRFYMGSHAIDTPASVNITQFNLLVYGARYYSKQQQQDTLTKSKLDLRYRYLSPVRALLTTQTLNAGSQYNLSLTAGSGLSAFLVFRIYDSAFNFATALNYQPINTLQFNDKTNTLVGVNFTSNQLLTFVNKAFPGYILEYGTLNANAYSNIYIIPFTIAPGLAYSGNVAGFYNLTGLESIQFTVPTTFTSGSYNIEVMSYNYNGMSINKGMLTGFASE
jgi:hypothetical protein